MSDVASSHRASGIAWAEGVTALAVLIAMQQCKSALVAWRDSPDPFLKSVLFSGIFVNYARGFEEARLPGAGIARRFSTRSVPNPAFRPQLHRALLSMRNDQIAHVGHISNDVTMQYITVVADNKNDDQDIEAEPEICHLGTKARASVSLGPLKVFEKEFLGHCEALEVEAQTRLTRAILDHQILCMEMYAHDPAGARRKATTLKIASVKIPAKSLVILGDDDLHISLARSPSGLGLLFATSTYRIVLNASGRVDLINEVTWQEEADVTPTAPP